MAENPTYNVSFRDTTASDTSKTQQIGVQVQNYYGPPTETAKRAILNEFGPIDPREERRRIIAQKNSLIEGSCDWVLNDASFQKWREEENSILWISGGPGQGKTMIMDAVLSECDKQSESGETVVAYFFCQATDDRLNNAVAVLKGLLLMLISRHSGVANYFAEFLKARPQQTGEQASIWALWDTLEKMLDSLPNTSFYFFIDALDECSTEGLDLIDQIIQDKGKSRVRWVITSRNEPDIKERLAHENVALQISLEANMGHVGNAKSQFIDHKVDELQRIKGYDAELASEVKTYLQQNAEDTFLWVAIVCQELRKLDRSDVQEHLHTFPTGLTPLYERMIAQVTRDEKRANLCLRILRTVAVLYRPQTIYGIGHICGLPEQYLISSEDILTLIARCGSFLVVRDDKVYFVHQSAADFIIGHQTIFDTGVALGHSETVSGLVKMLQNGLKKDICNTGSPSANVQDMSETKLSASLPSYMQYASRYWMEHLIRAGQPHFSELGFCDHGDIHEFLKSHLLLWFESLSWLQDVSLGISGLESLLKLTKQEQNCTELGKLLYEATCFLAEFRAILDVAPLQIYISGLIFSPQQSLIRELYSNAWPDWLLWAPEVEDNWDPSSRALDGHSDRIECIKFSPNGEVIASCSVDRTVRAWESKTGQRLGVLTNLSSKPTSLIFSEDSKTILVMTENNILHTWEFNKKSAVGKVALDLSSEQQVSPLVLSSNGKLAAMACTDELIKIWDVSKKELLHEIEAQLVRRTVQISPNGAWIAYNTKDGVIVACPYDGDVNMTMKERFLLTGNQNIFSPDSTKIFVGGSANKWGFVCDIESGNEVASVMTGSVYNLLRREGIQADENIFKWTYSNDSKFFAGSGKAWRRWTNLATYDVERDKILGQSGWGYGYRPCTPSFSPDNSLIACATTAGIIVRGINDDNELYTIKAALNTINTTTFHPTEPLLAYDTGPSIRLFDTGLGTQQSVKRRGNGVYDKIGQVASSYPHNLIAYISSTTWNDSVLFWNLSNPREPLLDDVYTSAGLPIHIEFHAERGIIAIQLESSRELVIYDVKAKRKLGDLCSEKNEPKPKYEKLEFQSDGKQLVATGKYKGKPETRTFTWDIDTQTLISCTINETESNDNSDSNKPKEEEIDILSPTLSPIKAPGKDLSLDKSYQWITWKGQKLIWLPEQCRPSANRRVTHPNESFTAIESCLVVSGRFRATWLVFDLSRLQDGNLLGTHPRPPQFSELEYYNNWKKGVGRWKRVKKFFE